MHFDHQLMEKTDVTRSCRTKEERDGPVLAMVVVVVMVVVVDEAIIFVIILTVAISEQLVILLHMHFGSGLLGLGGRRFLLVVCLLARHRTAGINNRTAQRRVRRQPVNHLIAISRAESLEIK